MKIFRHIFIGLSLATLFIGCSEEGEEIADARAIKFSVEAPRDGFSSRAASPSVFGAGDGVGVFACYKPQGDDGTTPFVANFMHNQLVSFDGLSWTYSPLKYWHVNGTVEFRGYFPYNKEYDNLGDWFTKITHECKTGFEPLYEAHSLVKAENGALSGDGVGANGNLRLGFTPLLNKVNFTANADDGLFDEVESDEYKYCRFLIKEFRIWGFYRKGEYNMSDGSWELKRSSGSYSKKVPLEMTRNMDRKKIEDVVPGYVYNPADGYCTDTAVVISEGEDPINIFGKSVYLIPMNGVISGNNPGFEVVYVVLTKKDGEDVYKESGIVTRSGSLREIFADQKGLIKKIIHVNLEFSIDGVTVTRNLEDYHYKPMF